VPTLAIRLLGGVQVEFESRPLGGFPTHWAAGLLAYLALRRGRLIHRDVVTRAFWPEMPDARARKALRRALWRLRGCLDEAGVPGHDLFLTEGSALGMRGPPHTWVDVAEFDRLADVGGGETVERVRFQLQGAVALYEGDFMDGYAYEWSLFERERLRLSFLATLDQLMSVEMRLGRWDRAILHGRAALRRDPLREHVHRNLMLCHHAMGDRPLALRQYDTCRRILREELDIEPMEETRRLREELWAGGDDAPDLGAREVAARVRTVLRRARETVSALRGFSPPAGEEGAGRPVGNGVEGGSAERG
jgi:DNA-binding SARP family transcriptional activator